VARAGHDAVWSPDGRSLVFLSDESGVLGIRRAAVGASAVAESLYTGPLAGAPNGWLADGSTLLMSGVRSAEGGLDVLAVRNSGAGPVEPFVATAANELSAAASPDGRWLAFVSERTGRSEVYVRPLAGTAADVAVSLDGGSEPVWSRDGKELFYRGTTELGTWLIAARVESGPVFRAAARTPLFSVTGFLASEPHSNFDVAPDGRHFVFVQGYEITRVAVVQNLPALVRQLSGPRR
jgi:serine/threonine-protein kinase